MQRDRSTMLRVKLMRNVLASSQPCHITFIVAMCKLYFHVCIARTRMDPELDKLEPMRNPPRATCASICDADWTSCALLHSNKRI